jgi:hypothetical protein
MIKSQFTYLLPLFFSGILNAQFTPVDYNEQFITPCPITSIIKEKHISSITIRFQVKPDGETIKDEGMFQQFYFDSSGNMTSSIQVTSKGNLNWDSVQTFYYYNTAGCLTIKRTNAGNYYDSWYYSWYDNPISPAFQPPIPQGGRDAGHILKRIAHVHESITTQNGLINIGSQTIISNDSIFFNMFQNQLQLKFFNEENKVYQEKIYDYNNAGQPFGIYSKFTVGAFFLQEDMKYNASGKITEYNYNSNMNGEEHRKTILTYDSLGNPESGQLFISGNQTGELKFIHDADPVLICTRLERDYDKKVIYIRLYSYEYYNLAKGN